MIDFEKFQGKVELDIFSSLHSVAVRDSRPGGGVVTFPRDNIVRWRGDASDLHYAAVFFRTVYGTGVHASAVDKCGHYAEFTLGQVGSVSNTPSRRRVMHKAPAPVSSQAPARPRPDHVPFTTGDPVRERMRNEIIEFLASIGGLDDPAAALSAAEAALREHPETCDFREVTVSFCRTHINLLK